MTLVRLISPSSFTMMRFKAKKRPTRHQSKNPPKGTSNRAGMVQIDLGSIDEEQVEDIKVVARVRPLTRREKDPNFLRKASAGERAWKIIPEHQSVMLLQRNQTTVAKEDRRQNRSLFTFDKVFGEDSETEEVYDCVAKELVESAVDGRNGSIFAYGQTGSGKTHTMQGVGGSIRDVGMGLEGKKMTKGIIQMVAEDLFNLIEQVEDRDYVLQVSVIEVYNEEVRDLLSKKDDARLMIREDPGSGVFVGAVRREANSLNKLLAILSGGERNRVVARTALNRKSSRSHIIFSINIESFPVEETGGTSRSNSYIQRSNLNLIDLAGSESVRHRSAHSTEKRRKEGGSINKSLLTLSLVIQALGAPRRSQIRTGHINYRDSKLTRVLQPSLSGNARLAFICCVTTSGLYMEETKSTFQFASRIKLIKTKSKINIMDNAASIETVQDELKEAKRNMVEMEKDLRKTEKDNKHLHELLEAMTMQRDEALESAANFEKAKNAAVLAATEGSSRRRSSENQSSKPPLSTHMKSGAIAGGGQAGFLSDMVGKIRSTVNPAEEVDTSAYQKRQETPQNTSAYQKRQETPLELFEEPRKTIHGMPAHIRADSSKFSIQSELTHATNYEPHWTETEQDKNMGNTFASPKDFPILGLVDGQSIK